MKKFDLEAAKRGEPIVTRDGQPVVFGAVNLDARPDWQITGWVGGRAEAWRADGAFYAYDLPSDMDLFMASKKVQRWINVYREPSLVQSYAPGALCESPAKAVQARVPNTKTTGTWVACVPVEWEE